MSKKQVLEELLREREEVYGELTVAMFGELDNCIDAITLVYDGILSEYVWIDVSHEEINDVLIISADATYVHPLIKVQTAGGIIEVATVDKDGKKIRKDIHVGIPFELALTGNINDVYQFLTEIEETKTPAMFSIENDEGRMVPMNAYDQAFDEIYEEMEKSKSRILH